MGLVARVRRVGEGKIVGTGLQAFREAHGITPMDRDASFDLQRCGVRTKRRQGRLVILDEIDRNGTTGQRFKTQSA